MKQRDFWNDDAIYDVPYSNWMRISKFRAHFKYFQVQTHVQTARESPDLNMDFRSFDNGCEQLYEWISMQE